MSRSVEKTTRLIRKWRRLVYSCEGSPAERHECLTRPPVRPRAWFIAYPIPAYSAVARVAASRACCFSPGPFELAT
jgi:hypothetical protein